MKDHSSERDTPKFRKILRRILGKRSGRRGKGN